MCRFKQFRPLEIVCASALLRSCEVNRRTKLMSQLDMSGGNTRCAVYETEYGLWIMAGSLAWRCWEAGEKMEKRRAIGFK